MGALFTPPETDKVISRGGREKLPAYIFIDPEEPNVLYISTVEDVEIKDNSIYDLMIPELEFEDETVETKFKHSFITAPSPAYVEVDDVLKECRNIPVDTDLIIYNIVKASNTADYWAYKHMEDSEYNNSDPILKKETIKEDYYPFYMFVKYSALAGSLKAFYLKMVSQPYKFKDIISDLERDEEMDLSAIKKLIDDIEVEAKDWLELIVHITADPEWALRGKYSYAITNKYYRPYHPTLIDRTGWDRGY